jgi:hypothetical protein
MVISANTPKPHAATCLAVRNHAQRPFVAKRRPRSVFIAAGSAIRARHTTCDRRTRRMKDEQASEVEVEVAADPTQHCHNAAPAEALQRENAVFAKSHNKQNRQHRNTDPNQPTSFTVISSTLRAILASASRALVQTHQLSPQRRRERCRARRGQEICDGRCCGDED